MCYYFYRLIKMNLYWLKHAGKECKYIAEGVKRSGKKKTVCGQYSGEFLRWMPKVQAGNRNLSGKRTETEKTFKCLLCDSSEPVCLQALSNGREYVDKHY